MRARRAWVLAAAALAVAALGGAHTADSAPQSIIVGNDAPDWSPDGTKIVFTSFRHGSGEIYVMNVDGTEQRRLTNHPAHDDHAKWSPDGTKIVFTTTRDGNHEIYVMNADGTGVRRLTNDPHADFSATWSPDGKRIAWRSNRDGDGAADQAPAWGPGGRIAFVSSRDGGVLNLWTMNGDGSDLRRVTRSITNEDRPAWSPDGTLLLYVSQRDLPLGNTEIYRVPAEGGPTQRLTNHDGRDDWPSWSPDGTQILFSRGVTIRSPEVFVANADGTNMKQVTRTPSRLEIVDAYAPHPVAGRSWTILLVGQDVTERPITRGAAICRATLGGKALKLAGSGFERGVVRCTWTLPKTAKGKTLRGSVGLQVGTLRAQVPFALRVR
jgi:Tol biopolymer transport system component